MRARQVRRAVSYPNKNTRQKAAEGRRCRSGYVDERVRLTEAPSFALDDQTSVMIGGRCTNGPTHIHSRPLTSFRTSH